MIVTCWEINKEKLESETRFWFGWVAGEEVHKFIYFEMVKSFVDSAKQKMMIIFDTDKNLMKCVENL